VLVLALDTATEAVVAAVLRRSDGRERNGGPGQRTEVLGRGSGRGPMAHGEQVAVVVEQALTAAGVTVRELDVVGVGRGPGPFTGLRVGLVFAETLGWSLGIPVHGVCTLDVLAAEALAESPAELLVATDARRREVYWARYAADGRRLEGPSVSAPLYVPDRELPAVGAGALRYPEAFPSPRRPVDPDAAVLARLVADAVTRGDQPEVTPLYLRRPDAVPAAARKTVTPR